MRKKKSALLANRNKSGYLFTAPYIIGMLVLFIPTVVYSLIYSFSKVEIQFDNVATTFVGFKNFTDAFGVDIYFRQYLLDAVRGMLINTVIILLFSFFVANLLNQKFVGRGFARAILFLPVILSTGIVAEADIGNVVSDMFASDSNSAESIAKQIGTENSELSFGAVREYSVGEAKPLFARLDAEKVMAEIESEKQEKTDNVAKISQIGIEDFAKVELKAAKILLGLEV